MSATRENWPPGDGRLALHGSSKAALNLLTKAWAAEFGPRGVRVNVVEPGPTRTETTVGTGDDLDARADAGPDRPPGRTRGNLR